MSAYYSIYLPESYGSSYFEVRMSSSTPSNFGYHKLKKLVEKCLDVYELMVEESLLACHSKVFAMREVLILATQLCMYTKRMV